MLEVKRSIKEDWALLPFLVTTSAGFVVAIVDFVYLQNLKFQVFGLVGLSLSAIGGYLRHRARLELKEKAGFETLVSTGRLQVVESHRLVKDGLYKRVRHPIYLGETVRNLGFVLIPSSIYGASFIAVATVFLLFRIEIEERMLIETFGDEYREYQRNTKRIVSYVY